MTTYEQLHDDFLKEYGHGNYSKAVVLATQMIELDDIDPQGYINKADAYTMLDKIIYANELRNIALWLEQSNN